MKVSSASLVRIDRDDASQLVVASQTWIALAALVHLVAVPMGWCGGASELIVGRGHAWARGAEFKMQCGFNLGK